MIFERNYFECKDMETNKFQHFPKGIDELGPIVEVCVRITKQSIFESIHKIFHGNFNIAVFQKNTWPISSLNCKLCDKITNTFDDLSHQLNLMFTLNTC